MRINKDDVNYYVAIANNLLKDFGMQDYELEFTSRNGYKAIDIKLKHGAKTLATGLSTKEAYKIVLSIVDILNDLKKEVDAIE